ncbi:MAG: prephenate dehydrogenase/arogenate dehydrogenase family protein [Candidatus Zambryskibacteria bacterium]|nr:prephenate dehydrogenase/arogenate dehydrogenase family protein [Candidatus Zambryskibacteria bacterium]
MTVSIIGFGRFGKTLHRLLRGHFDIVLFDISLKAFNHHHLDKRTHITKSLKRVYASDTIFYCVPIPKFESVVKHHKKYFRDNHILIDTLSVKMFPEKVFSKYLKDTKTGAILTHPMFGPDSSKDGFDNLRIVMNQCISGDREYSFWKNYFASCGLNVVELPPKKHDELAARSQGVTHFIGQLLADFKFSKTPIDTKSAEELYKVMEQTCNDS